MVSTQLGLRTPGTPTFIATGEKFLFLHFGNDAIEPSFPTLPVALHCPEPAYETPRPDPQGQSILRQFDRARMNSRVVGMIRRVPAHSRHIVHFFFRRICWAELDRDTLREII